jgi:hypothetical protein
LVAAGLPQHLNQLFPVLDAARIQFARRLLIDSLAVDNFVGQVLNADAAALAEDECILDGIAQLPDIARPWVFGQGLQGVGGQSENFLAAADRIAADKALGNQRNIFPTTDKGGQFKGKTLIRK